MKPRHLSDLSPGMVRALIRCSTMPVEVLDERHCGIAARTLTALMRRDLISVQVDNRLRRVYRPTAAGALLLRTEEPLYLHQRASAGYTKRVEHAMREELVADEFGQRRAMPVEAVHPAVLDKYAKKAHERDAARLAGVDDALLAQQRALEQRIADLKVLANQRGVPAADRLRVAGKLAERAHRELDAVEARIREQTRNRAA